MSWKRKINLEALKEVVDSIAASGRVVNAQALAALIGVNKSTITRNLRMVGIPLPVEGQGRFQRSTDEEPRSHEEIIRMIREAIACEPKHRPHTDVDLIAVLGLRAKERNMRKIRAEAGIPSAPQRRRNYLLERS
jgi:DNA-directed RNA polymerase specialized sigma54-like protein